MNILRTFGIGQVPSQSVATFGSPSQQVTILDPTNPKYPRQIVLSQQGIKVIRGNISAGIAISDLLAAIITIQPSLSPPPFIVTNPSDTTAQYGQTAVFGVTVTSEQAPSYQWQVSSDGGVTYTNLANNAVYSNVNSATLSISNSGGLNGYYYRCVVTNSSGSATSKAALFTVQDPGIITQPASVTVTHPAAASFSVTATGATTITYQWQLSTDGGVTWNNLSDTGVYTGSATSTLHISNSTGLNAGQYRCALTDTAGTRNTNAATLTVN